LIRLRAFHQPRLLALLIRAAIVSWRRKRRRLGLRSLLAIRIRSVRLSALRIARRGL
jgi:hypothetical protein